ncbi:MAG: type 1 glutamine amidotransferase [Spirochaetia bacterium]|nr:type 1 glutamine amidotransferase [Spirochaetia bacterium]
MNFYCLTHVPFEGPAYLENWAVANNHTFVTAKSYEFEFPDLKDYDVLVSMGGPMSANDDHIYPWLKEEKKIIEKAISNNKKFIGICLGAQIAANVLGAKVKLNPQKEIGWFDVQLTKGGRSHRLFSEFADTFPVFHWHGETFEIPKGALHLMQSTGCDNQGFIYGDHILGLQFHMEGTEESIIAMMDDGLDELIPDRFVQSESVIREKTVKMAPKANALCGEMMNLFLKD